MVMRPRAGVEVRVHPSTPLTGGTEYMLADLSDITVLVVDDDSDARDLIKRILDECRAKVFTTGSATEALEIMRIIRPDVLISDIGMPAVDGYELLERIRQIEASSGGGVNAIALTAFARSEDRARALRAGFVNHLAKPVEPSELIATVASAAGRTGNYRGG